MSERPTIDTYSAFISYSHANKTEAEKLLKQLQSFRIPKTLRTSGAHSLGRFFIDREALPVSQDLSQAIRQGLAKSQRLIVICSPEAQASHWVNKEIDAYRELHPNGPILPVILDSKGARGQHPTALLPASIVSHTTEPLCADFRAEGDGPYLGRLKLIAGLLDVPLELLLQKETKRRNRRVMAVTTGSLLIGLIMTGLAVQAVLSSMEADKRRLEAEGLMNFMLYDLRDKLVEVGRLEILDQVVDQAIGYYQSQAPNSLECAAVVRNVKAHHLAAEVALQKEDLAQTGRAAENALDVIEAHRAECGQTPDFMVAAGHSEYWAASPIWKQARFEKIDQDLSHDTYTEKFAQTISYYERYKKEIQPLEHIPAYWRTYNQEMSDVSINLGSAYIELGETVTAAEYFADAVDYLSAIALTDGAVPSDPEILTQRRSALFTLANAIGWCAYLAEGNSDWVTARNAREAEFKITNRLAHRDPEQIDMSAKAHALKTRMTHIRLDIRRGLLTSTDEEAMAVERELVEFAKFDAANQNWSRLLRRYRDMLVTTERSPPKNTQADTVTSCVSNIVLDR